MTENKIILGIKRFIKGLFFKIVLFFPDRYFFKLRDKVARTPRRGSILEIRFERFINYLNKRIVIDKLMKNAVPYFNTSVENRYEIYEYVIRHYVKSSIDLLEFGVADGKSIRWFLSKLNSSSRIFGFDSFEGLPEAWYKDKKGKFDRGGLYRISLFPMYTLSEDGLRIL